MTQRGSFDRDYLKQEFDKLDGIAKRCIDLFLIGGGAMAFYGLKVATKHRHHTHKPRRPRNLTIYVSLHGLQGTKSHCHHKAIQRDANQRHTGKQRWLSMGSISSQSLRQISPFR